MKFALSVIIPTYKRPDTLRKCLDCIAAQTLKDLEVIVVSDGPDEKTSEMLMSLEWPFELQHFSIPKSQQGVCRNRGVEKARGEYALLIGDDMFLAPDACERHLHAHEKSEKDIAVLGFTTWDPSLKVTPLMKWLETSGVQFGYPKIAQYKHQLLPSDQQHWFTYTINFSLSSKLLFQNKFREDVQLYGWEDMEWGKRLADADIPVFYEPDAKGYHHHQFTNAEVWERSKMLGKSAVVMEKIVPDLQLTPKGFKKIAYFIISFLPTCRGRHCWAFLRGMRMGSF